LELDELARFTSYRNPAQYFIKTIIHGAIISS